MKKEIKSFLADKPDGQFSVGLLATKVGTKYVHYMSLYDGGTDGKIPLEDFYAKYVASHPLHTAEEIAAMERRGNDLILQGYHI